MRIPTSTNTSGHIVTMADRKRQLVEKLRRPTGRGGHRLSREEGDLLLLLLGARPLTPEERHGLRMAIDTVRRRHTIENGRAAGPGNGVLVRPSGRQAILNNGQIAT